MVSLIPGPEVHSTGHANHEESIEYDLKKPAERLGNGGPIHIFHLTYFHYCPTQFSQGSDCFSSS